MRNAVTEIGMTADFTEIIKLAELSNKDENKDTLTAEEWADLGRDLGPDLGLVLFAARILAGKPCEVEVPSNTPEGDEALERFRALVSYLGAIVARVNNGPGSVGLVFSPPSRH
jgi:hypothetical protein